MNSKGFEVLFLMAAFAAAIILVADGADPTPSPVDARRRSSTGSCPACKGPVEEGRPGYQFACQKCGARLRQETPETVIQED